MSHKGFDLISQENYQKTAADAGYKNHVTKIPKGLQ